MVNRDERLYSAYQYLFDTLWCASVGMKAAEKVFWMQAYRLLDQSELVQKSDLIGTLMDLVKGNNHGCDEIYYLNDAKPDAYWQFDEEYRLCDVLGELGSRWKALFNSDDPARVLALRDWLRVYVDVCMPGINRFIAEKEVDSEFGGDPQRPLSEAARKKRQQAYRATRAQMKRLLAKLDVLEEVSNLRGDVPFRKH